MERKLIKQGGSGLVAYIPKKWVDEKGLKAGDKVNFIEEAGDLILSGEFKEDKKQIELDFKEEDPLFIKIIINDLYRSGIDKMIIAYSSKEQLNTINETVNNYLLGFEITEKTKDRVIIENITLPENEKQEILLRRIFFIIEDMFDLIEQKINNPKSDAFKEIEEDKRKIGQYDNFSRRNISKKKFYQESSSFYWMFYNQIYLISHSLFHFYSILKDNKNYKISKEVAELFKVIRGFYSNLEAGFFKKDLAILKKINSDMNNLLYKKVYAIMKESKGVEIIILHYIAELDRLLYKINQPVMGILLTSEKYFKK